MTGRTRSAVLTGSLAAVAATGLIDALTGLLPSLRVLYLLPVLAAAGLLGFWYGLLLSVVATASDLVVGLYVGQAIGARYAQGAAIRLLTYVVAGFVVDRLVARLRTIRQLEERRSYDLDLARRIHRAVFVPAPERHPNLAVAVRQTFSAELGGDYYHFSTLGDRLFFCIGDIAGHSVAAAMFTMLLHETLKDALGRSQELGAMMSLVNNRMFEAMPDDMFVTLFAALVHRQAIDFVNAGHEPPLLFSSKQQRSSLVTGPEPMLPLGVEPALDIVPLTRPLNVGDVLLAVTDGVTESRAFRDKPVGKLQALLSTNGGEEPERIVEAVHDVAVGSTGEPPLDDVTVVCIKRR